MGTGLILPSTRLTLDGVTYDSGDIELLAGVGIKHTRTPGHPVVYQSDALHVDAPEVFSLYASGSPAVGSLGVWHNTRVSARAVLRALEVNSGTAPTTGDGANFYAIRAADGAGGAAQCPISTPGSTHYFLDQGSGMLTVAGQVAQGLPASTTNFPNGTTATLAQVATFTPTSVITATGLRWYGGLQRYNTSGGPALAGTVRGVIVDMAGNIVASAHANVSAQCVNEVSFVFPSAVTLAQGTTYGFGIDVFEFSLMTDAQPLGFVGWVPGGTAFGSMPATPVGSRSMNAFPTLVKLLDWPDFMTTTESGQVATGGFTQGNTSPCGTPGAGVLAAGGGTVLTGDVTLSLVTAGAPLATALPTNLNIRALLDTG